MGTPSDPHVETLRESIELHDDPETREQYLGDYSEDLVLHGIGAAIREMLDP